MHACMPMPYRVPGSPFPEKSSDFKSSEIDSDTI